MYNGLRFSSFVIGFAAQTPHYRRVVRANVQTRVCSFFCCRSCPTLAKYIISVLFYFPTTIVKDVFAPIVKGQENGLEFPRLRCRCLFLSTAIHYMIVLFKELLFFLLSSSSLFGRLCLARRNGRSKRLAFCALRV